VESPEAVEKLEISENQDNSWPLLPRDQPTDQVEVLWTRPEKFTTHLCFEVGGGRGRLVAADSEDHWGTSTALLVGGLRKEASQESLSGDFRISLGLHRGDYARNRDRQVFLFSSPQMPPYQRGLHMEVRVPEFSKRRK
jgi:hypothetical protein